MCCDAVAVVARVACWVELNGVGEQHRALAIHVDAAPFVDDPRTFTRHRQNLGDLTGDGVVMAPLEFGILSPSVELPVDRSERTIFNDKCRPNVPKPGIVQVHRYQVDRFRESALCRGQVIWMA